MLVHPDPHHRVGSARWTCGLRIASKAQPTDGAADKAAATAAANESCPQDERQGGAADRLSVRQQRAPFTSAWRRIVIGCHRPRRRRGWYRGLLGGRLDVCDSIDGADCHESQLCTARTHEGGRICADAHGRVQARLDEQRLRLGRCARSDGCVDGVAVPAIHPQRQKDVGSRASSARRHAEHERSTGGWCEDRDVRGQRQIGEHPVTLTCSRRRRWRQWPCCWGWQWRPMRRRRRRRRAGRWRRWRARWCGWGGRSDWLTAAEHHAGSGRAAVARHPKRCTAWVCAASRARRRRRGRVWARAIEWAWRARMQVTIPRGLVGAGEQAL